MNEEEYPYYRYRPRMVGAEFEFRLGPDSLEWRMGNISGRVAYPMIVYVRLGYRSTNFGRGRFVAEIWPRNGAKIEILSTSYRSLFEMQDHAVEYRAFIGELHRRIAAAGASCEFEAGQPAWRWWPMVAVAVGIAGLLVFLAVKTLFDGDLTTSVFVLAFLALLAWQMGPMVVRNQPRLYSPDRIPERVLPSG